MMLGQLQQMNQIFNPRVVAPDHIETKIFFVAAIL